MAGLAITNTGAGIAAAGIATTPEGVGVLIAAGGVAVTAYGLESIVHGACNLVGDAGYLFASAGGGGGGTGNKWGNLNTLEKHFNDHGKDFGAKNPEDYARQANEFYNNRANCQVKVDQDGVIRVYDPTTNTFGSYNADGTTKTFFKPTAGQRYFNRQPGQ